MTCYCEQIGNRSIKRGATSALSANAAPSSKGHIINFNQFDLNTSTLEDNVADRHKDRGVH